MDVFSKGGSRSEVCLPLVEGCRCSDRNGDVAQMVERPLSMREVQGSIPCFSTF